MVVVWKSYKSVMTLDLEELEKCYGKTEEVFDNWGHKGWCRLKRYGKAKLLRLFKAVRYYDCNHTKADIVAEIKDPDLRALWEEYYEQA